MATAYTKMVTEPTIMERVTTELDKQLARLDVISEEIKENFEKLMSEVDARRAKLLDQIEKMKTEFETKNKTVVENLRELESMSVIQRMYPANVTEQSCKQKRTRFLSWPIVFP